MSRLQVCPVEDDACGLSLLEAFLLCLLLGLWDRWDMNLQSF